MGIKHNLLFYHIICFIVDSMKPISEHLLLFWNDDPANYRKIIYKQKFLWKCIIKVSNIKQIAH